MAISTNLYVGVCGFGDNDEVRRAVFEALDRYAACVLHGDDEWDSEDLAGYEPADLTDPLFICNTDSVDWIAEETAEQLAALPGVGFVLWQEPRFDECSGIAVLHVPEYGTWRGSCDTGGNIQIPAEVLEELAYQTPHDPVSQEQLALAVGQQHRQWLLEHLGSNNAATAGLHSVAHADPSLQSTEVDMTMSSMPSGSGQCTAFINDANGRRRCGNKISPWQTRCWLHGKS